VKLGIFGGTFDPPHLGHLIVAQDACAMLGLERVRFVPAAEPPHKAAMPLTPAPVRLRLLRAALGSDARFEVDDVELRRGGRSYTVDTLRAVRAADPGAELYLLIGSDQYVEFGGWREPEAILELARLAVLSRGAAVADEAIPAGGPEMAGRIVQVAVTRVDISSTQIRARVAAGEPIRYLVPDAVAALIEASGLYCARGPEHA
jgi:nicotinate-nucleotide adenylyltransferase